MQWRAGVGKQRLTRGTYRIEHIMQIQNEAQKSLHESEDILTGFAQYYTHLYTTRVTPQSDSYTAYFDRIALAWIEGPRRLFLNEPITLDEITTAIAGLPMSKVPGPDGFPTEY